MTFYDIIKGLDWEQETKSIYSKTAGDVQKALSKGGKLNGEDFSKAWIEHNDIVMGGTLVLEMGPVPSDWGTALLPPSKSEMER